MATGTITFGGIGSGIDTESIVTGLVNASSEQLNALKQRQTDTSSAVTSLSDISTLLSGLKNAATALSDVRDAKSYSASVAGDGVVATASGAALPGSFSVEVINLAKEHRSYSNTFTSSTDALGQSGTLSLAVGTVTPTDIDISSTDSLNDIADKINAAGLRASASVFYDGTTYRLQLRGLDTGSANAITATESGTTLGLDDPDNTFQAATDAKVKIDGFTVTRPTNQITGAIQGVTLALTAPTTTNAVVSVASDPNALGTKVKAFVDAYNQVVTKIHVIAGFGTTKGTSAVLSGDSTLRSITSRLSDTLLATVPGAGTYNTLSSIGVSLNRDGTITLDQTKLSTAISTDTNSVAAVLAGAGTGDGAMDVMKNLVTTFTQSSTGILSMEKDSMDSRAKSLGDSVTRENDRLQKYADDLRKQFTAMDTTVAGNNSDLSYLTKLYG